MLQQSMASCVKIENNITLLFLLKTNNNFTRGS